LPSHRYSRPRYSPSAHALDTRSMRLHTMGSRRMGPHTIGTQTLVAVGAVGATGARFMPAGSPVTTRAHSITSATPAALPRASFADTLLPHIQADEQAFVLRYVQPGLVGLIDGTLSTLAPIFAVALLSSPHAALLVGLATALGAGISMGLSEALSDDGGQTGRGSAITRGSITGMMTTVGGVFHALPFLISDLTIALSLAAIVVAVELTVIALIRKRYLEVSLRCSLIQVVLGGMLIVGVGLWLGGL
jgi:erythrin-vacuolar iron transport family protein